mgnify:CR=1 FL=1
MINKTTISIFPNPASEKISIDYTEMQRVKMKVYNTIGECVLQSDLIGGTNMINISSLTSGIYMIRLTSVDGAYQQKLMKN